MATGSSAYGTYVICDKPDILGQARSNVGGTLASEVLAPAQATSEQQAPSACQ